jgi:hypothetical protein
LDTDSEIIVSPKQRKNSTSEQEDSFNNSIPPSEYLLGRAICWEETALQGLHDFDNFSALVVIGCRNASRISPGSAHVSLPIGSSAPEVMKLVYCKSPQQDNSALSNISDNEDDASTFVHVLESPLIAFGHVAVPLLIRSQLNIERFSRVK